MDWQEPAALVVVGGTLLLIIVQRVRRFRRRGLRSCGADCHCPGLASTAPKPYLSTLPHRTEK